MQDVSLFCVSNDEQFKFCFLALGFLHGVQGEFTDDVLEIAVVPTFTGHE